MYLVNQYRRQINQFICASTPAAFRLACIFLLAALAAFGGAFFVMGAPAMNGRPWDTAFFLDGGWRIATGQIPHVDFYACTGALPYYITWLGIKLSRPCVSAITYGNAVLMIAIGLSAMGVLRVRTSALYASAMSLFLALLAVAPRPLGDPCDYTDYAMLYNRYGEAFIGLFAVVLFLRPAPGLGQKFGDSLGTVFTGSLLTILLFCKINYFLLGVGLFVVACLLGRFSVRGVLLCLLSSVIVFSIISLATHIPASAIWRDYRTVAAAPNRLKRLHVLAAHSIESFFYLPVLALLVWEMATKPGERSPSWRALWQPLVLMASLFGGALLLISTNTQLSEMPLLAVAGLCGAEVIRRNSGATQEDSFLVTARNLGGLSLFALLLVPTFATDCTTVMFAARDAMKSNWVSTDILRSTQLNDFRFTKNGTRSAEMKEYMEFLDEGIQLLRRHPDAHMRLTVLLFSNPFHFALGLVPAHGGVVGLAVDSLAQRSHPPMKRLLGDATHILMDDGNLALMREAYGTEWDGLHLEVIEQTKHFTLFKLPKASQIKPERD